MQPVFGRDATAFRIFFFIDNEIFTYDIYLQHYHGTALPSQKNPPLGPLPGSVAAQTIPFAPSSTGRPPRPPISVATHPGSTEFTSIPVFTSSAASFLVSIFNAAFEML